ncbi:MAG: hypothetical protein HQK79_19945 [Desulfobacterales bacterium]|nr:hypothetical protein [Desulfobacterales bacterium]
MTEKENESTFKRIVFFQANGENTILLEDIQKILVMVNPVISPKNRYSPLAYPNAKLKSELVVLTENMSSERLLAALLHGKSIIAPKSQVMEDKLYKISDTAEFEFINHMLKIKAIEMKNIDIETELPATKKISEFQNEIEKHNLLIEKIRKNIAKHKDRIKIYQEKSLINPYERLICQITISDADMEKPLNICVFDPESIKSFIGEPDIEIADLKIPENVFDADIWVISKPLTMDLNDKKNWFGKLILHFKPLFVFVTFEGPSNEVRDGINKFRETLKELNIMDKFTEFFFTSTENKIYTEQLHELVILKPEDAEKTKASYTILPCSKELEEAFAIENLQQYLLEEKHG